MSVPSKQETKQKTSNSNERHRATFHTTTDKKDFYLKS